MSSNCTHCNSVMTHSFPNGKLYSVCARCIQNWMADGYTEPVVQSAKIDKEPKVDKLHEKTLYFQDEKSDKVYKVWIEYNYGTKWYQLKAAYGRRGGTFTETNKEISSLKENALYHLNTLIAHKKVRGYKDTLTEAYSPLNETAATPNQIKLLKSFVPVVPPGLTKKQAQFMIEKYEQEQTYKGKLEALAQKKGKTIQFKPIGMLPKKLERPVTPVPKEEPQIVSGPTGRRIKEID